MFKALFFTALITIEYLATTSSTIPVAEHIWDKANHFIAFSTLYILLSLAYNNITSFQKFIILISFGIQIEIVQAFLPTREFSILDILADTIGIIIGEILSKKLFKPIK